jgi:hypothetical protein
MRYFVPLPPPSFWPTLPRLCLCWLCLSLWGLAEQAEVSLAAWLPADFARDGSVSYHAAIQTAIDEAAARRCRLRFLPMVYRLDGEGWKLRSHSDLDMRGAEFCWSETCNRDASLFEGDGVSQVSLYGGTVVGRNDRWKDGVNIRGIFLHGPSRQLRIEAMHFRDLSSNGIGIFGSESNYVRDVWVEDVVVENCCKRYPEYLSQERGEPGSVREDQGDVACYFVEDFRVRGSRFERSRSDGTHFYRCRRGTIAENGIYRAKMGGFFLEQCEEVIGQGNLVVENGSRGATIERGCRNCVFAGNIVRGSGREGLWAPDCIGLVITGNLFELNGRKPNGPPPDYVWNANITINEARKEPTQSPTRDYLVSGNWIRTSSSQIAAIRVDAVAATESIVIHGNSLVGENRRILVEGPARNEVQVLANIGAEP